MQRKIVPALAKVGLSPVRIEHPLGVNTVPILNVFGAVVFMIDMGSKLECQMAASRAKNANVLFLALPRHTSEWPAIFAQAHVALPSEAKEDFNSPPLPEVVKLVEKATFGQAMTTVRERDGFTVSVVAEVIGISEEELLAYESGSEPIPTSVYSELLGLFPALCEVKEKPDLVDDRLPTGEARAMFTPGPEAPVVPSVVAQAKVPTENHAPAPPPAPAPERSVSAIVESLRVLGVKGRVLVFVNSDGSAAVEVENDQAWGWRGNDADEAIDAARLDLDDRLRSLEERTRRARSGLRVSV